MRRNEPLKQWVKANPPKQKWKMDRGIFGPHFPGWKNKAQKQGLKYKFGRNI